MKSVARLVPDKPSAEEPVRCYVIAVCEVCGRAQKSEALFVEVFSRTIVNELHIDIDTSVMLKGWTDTGNQIICDMCLSS